MANKIHIGDIIEIPTAKGLAYAQFSHQHPRYGALVRVLPDIFKSRPENLVHLAKQREIFFTFLPLQAAVNQKIFEVVANYPVPELAKQFPLFRAGVVDPVAKKVKSWWLWDGEQEWQVGRLTPDQKKLPIRGIWNDTLLVERIESGWTPNSDTT
jgi:hypothetical protein